LSKELDKILALICRQGWRTENKYSRWYDALMEKARQRVGLPKPYEKHHVWPISLGGARKSETVRLTFREHFLAHWLLTKFTVGEGQCKMLCALAIMGNFTYGKRPPPSWMYAIAKRACSQAQSIKLAKQWLNPDYRREQEKRFSQIMMKLWKDPEHRKRLQPIQSQAAKDQWLDQIFREMKSQHSKKQWLDIEFRNKVLQALEDKRQDPVYQEMMSQKAKDQWNDPNFRSMKTQDAKKQMEERWQDPSYREKRSLETAGENNPFFGRTHSEETKAVISTKAKARAPESSERIKGDGNPMKRPEVRAIVSAKAKARIATNGHPRHMAGKTHSAKTRAQISTSNQGRIDSPETRAKKSQAKKEYWRLKKLQAQVDQVLESSPEHLKKIHHSELVTEENVQDV
jgi:hypothetical protein